MKFSSISKVNGKVVQDSNGGDIVIHGPSVVRLKLSPEKVARYERRGADLVLVLNDGEEVLIKNFFVRYSADGEPLVSDSDSAGAGKAESVAADEDVVRNDLILEDDNGVLWWGQYPEEWTEFHFTEIEWNDAGFAAWPWLLGALGGAGAIALASGGKKNAPPRRGQ